MKSAELVAALALCLALAGCGSVSQELVPQANVADTEILHTAQGHLAPGVVVYDVYGTQLGHVIRVDPNYTFANGMRGGAHLDYNDPRAENGYLPLAYIDTAYVRP